MGTLEKLKQTLNDIHAMQAGYGSGNDSTYSLLAMNSKIGNKSWKRKILEGKNAIKRFEEARELAWGEFQDYQEFMIVDDRKYKMVLHFFT